MSEIEAVREMLRAMVGGPALPDDQMRVMYEQWGLSHPLPAGTEVTNITLGGVPAEKIVTPGAAADTSLLYLHGGG